MLLIVILFGFVTRRRIDKKFEYKIYSVLFRMFVAGAGIALLYEIGLQSNFSRIGWCYLFPLLVFFVVRTREGIIWVSVFYGVLAFLILHFDLQKITLFQLQELRYRFLISLFVACTLSLLLEHGFRHAQQRLLNHQRNLRESENRYRQAYEQLNTQMQERKQAEDALRESEEGARRLAQENAIFAEIGRIISSTLNIDEVYDRFATAVRRLIHFDRISICAIDWEQQTFTVAWAAGPDRWGRMPGDVFPLCQSDHRQFLQTPSSIFIQTEDIREIEERFPFLLLSFQYGFRSMISVPLILEDQVIGTLNLRSFKVNAYTERDLKIVESIGLQISGAVTNALLFSERKRAEEALKEKTEELARSNRDLEQFAYVASHDLQEPLRMVTSYVQLLARRYKGKLDSDADEFIGFAQDGATRMWDLINDLLTYSRVGMRGKQLEPTDCATVLHQTLDNLKVAIEENRALVTHDALPTVMANRPQLIQLFQNLIENAIKFHGAEPPRVHVSASRNGNGWIFSVRDNGIGIAPEYAKRIFIIFQRLHSRKKYAGTGIGLALCQKIVEQRGGRIWVESQVGEGATFYFTLPNEGGATSMTAGRPVIPRGELDEGMDGLRNSFLADVPEGKICKLLSKPG
jgi:signal transduction histidine kinase